MAQRLVFCNHIQALFGKASTPSKRAYFGSSCEVASLVEPELFCKTFSENGFTLALHVDRLSRGDRAVLENV
jgi:hypothetical protein